MAEGGQKKTIYSPSKSSKKRYIKLINSQEKKKLYGNPEKKSQKKWLLKSALKDAEFELLWDKESF